MASKLFVDEIESSTASGISVVGEIKLSTGKAIKNAAGTALLTEAGVLDNVALGSSVTSVPVSESGVKTAINASGDAPIYACRAWVNFNGVAVGSGTSYAYTVVSNVLTVTHAGHSRSIGDSVAVYVPVGTANLQFGLITVITTDTWSFVTPDPDTSGTLTYIVGGIRGSGNVSSVTDSGAGNYRVNFTTALPANYSVTGMTKQDQAGDGSIMFPSKGSGTVGGATDGADAMATSSFQFLCINRDEGAVYLRDMEVVCLSFFA